MKFDLDYNYCDGCPIMEIVWRVDKRGKRKYRTTYETFITCRKIAKCREAREALLAKAREEELVEPVAPEVTEEIPEVLPYVRVRRSRCPLCNNLFSVSLESSKTVTIGKKKKYVCDLCGAFIENIPEDQKIFYGRSR